MEERWIVPTESSSYIYRIYLKFSRRIKMIYSMIRSQQSPGNIFKIWISRDVEGWMCDEDSLPKGWMRKYQEELKTYYFDAVDKDKL